MKTAIQAFKKAYQTHDIDAIESLVDTHFDFSIEPVVFGTSNGEVFVSKEDITSLFKEDFLGEYPLDIASNTLHTIEYGPFTWFNVNAGLKYTFSTTMETYTNFLNYTKAITKKSVSPQARATEILFLLSHLMSDRAEAERSYLWDVNLCGIACNLRIHALVFSLPINTMSPDARLDQSISDVKEFEYEQEQLKKTSQKDVFDASAITRAILSNLSDKDVFVDEEAYVAHVHGDFAWVVTNGFYKTTLTLDERLLYTFDQLLESGDKTPKHTLFSLRRELVTHFHHDAVGEVMHVPFRYMAIFENIQGTWTEKKVSLTYPFNTVLEEKTDYATPLNTTD